MLFITALSVTDACAGAAGRRSDESTHEGEEAHGQGAGDAGGGGGAPAEARGKFCHVRTLPGRRAPRGGAPAAAAGAALQSASSPLVSLFAGRRCASRRLG
jgi:hypothetical protein